MASIEQNRAETALPGYYIWTAPEKPITIQLSLDAIDRISQVVMQGFGAVPRRGAEVGGILLGAVVPGDHLILRIDDFAEVACEHRFGPSFLLSEKDAAGFDEAYWRWQPDPENKIHSAGYFRSHTRDGLSLSDEDLKLFGKYFANPPNVGLLIKPSATRVPSAGFFFYEDGKLQNETYREFPFRRSDHDGSAGSSTRRPLSDPARPRRQRRPEPTPEPAREPAREPMVPQEKTLVRPLFHLPPEDPIEAPAPPASLFPESEPDYSPTSSLPFLRGKREWVWVSLSFLMLLLGVLLGFMAARSFDARARANATANPFGLNLTVTNTDDTLQLRWDRQSAAIRAAQKGTLEITDGAFSKRVELDPAQLQNGSVIYRYGSKKVTFRLEVLAHDRNTVSEISEWKQR